MASSTLYIGFDGHHVAVRSNAAEVLAWVERGFQQMLASESTGTIGRLEVHQEGGKYYLQWNDSTDPKEGELGLILVSLKNEVIRRLIRARSDLLWLHAAAAAYRGKAVVIPAISGQGKSTLVTNLCRKGWEFLSDDLIALDSASGEVLAFPLTPAVRNGHIGEGPVYHLSELRKTVIPLGPGSVRRESTPIGALVFPAFGPGVPSALVRTSPANAVLVLLKNCVNFQDHREEAVRHLTALVTRVPVCRLTYSDGESAAELVARTNENWLVVDDRAEVI